MKFVLQFIQIKESTLVELKFKTLFEIGSRALSSAQ